MLAQRHTVTRGSAVERNDHFPKCSRDCYTWRFLKSEPEPPQCPSRAAPVLASTRCRNYTNPPLFSGQVYSYGNWTIVQAATAHNRHITEGFRHDSTLR